MRRIIALLSLFLRLSVGCDGCKSGTYPNPYGGGCLPSPPGTYCPKQCDLPTPCPAGTYRPGSSGVDLSDCSPCPAGYYCPIQSVATTGCPVATYCPASSGAPTPCPAGTHRNAILGSRLLNCTACPAGSYCPIQSATPTPCRRGTWSGNAGAPSLSNCTLCPPGTYGSAAGRSAPCPVCDANSYCRTALVRASCPTHTASAAASYSVFQCRCDPGYNCSYYLTLYVIVSLNDTNVTSFNDDVDGVRTDFIAAVAHAAGVGTDRVVITGVAATNPPTRRIGSHPSVLVTIRAAIDALTAHPGATLLGADVWEAEEVVVVYANDAGIQSDWLATG